MLALVVIFVAIITFAIGMGVEALIVKHYEKEDELKKLKKEVEELKNVNPRDL